MKNSLIKTIITYIIFILIFVFLYKIWKFKNYWLYFVLWLVFIIIKTILDYFVWETKTYSKKFEFKRLNKEFKKWKIWFINYILVLNRNIIFPFILTIYMIYLLINQTHLFELDNIKIFKFINQNYLLWITIFSWILTVFKENIDEKYLIEKMDNIYKNVLLTVFLSVLWTYIIFNQVIKLWFLSYPISIISGILIFLVWISILEDNEEENI